jgi:hypothetical protein
MWFPVLLAFVLLCLLSSSFCQDTQKSPDWGAQILSKVEKERASGRRAVITQHSKTVTALLKIVEGPVKEGESYYSSSTSRNIAIRLLGKLRAKSAVSRLMGWLAPKKGQSESMSEVMKYGHAGYALVEIGLPAVSHLLDGIKKEGMSRIGKTCAVILVDIEGKEKAKLTLNGAVEKTEGTETKGNLKKALEYIQKMK